MYLRLLFYTIACIATITADERHGTAASPRGDVRPIAAASATHDDHDHAADAIKRKDTSILDDDHDHDDGLVELTADDAREAGLLAAIATSGVIDVTCELSGAIVLNEDRYTHILSRVPGTVVDVRKRLGDAVHAGEILAVVDSTELADVKAEYLAALERYELERSIFAQEEEIWQKKISSQRDFLNAKRNLADADIALRSARQKVLSLGFDEEYLARLPAAPRTTLTRYNLIAPFDGTVVEKHITLGEVLKPDSEAALFGVADLRTVWVDLHVPQIDLLRVQPGQHALVSAGDGIPPVACVIEYVGPVIGAETRTALARATIANTAGVYRPGLFVTARVALERVAVPVCVPSDAVQIVDGEPCVFIQQGHGFLPRPVVTGIRDDQFIQIHSGMNAGEPYVARGAFTLKAILATSGLDSHAGHGH